LSAEVSPRRRFLLAFAICAILGGLGGLTMAELQSDPEARPRFIPPREEARDFRLRDQDGDVTTLWDVRGDPILYKMTIT
jgi:cytochrome oxidase Cu insertion factor (SCO1/SenC/PrrC family)